MEFNEIKNRLEAVARKYDLTKRETQMLLELCLGEGTSEVHIMGVMGIRRATVQRHKHSLRVKMGCSSCAQAMQKAWKEAVFYNPTALKVANGEN